MQKVTATQSIEKLDMQLYPEGGWFVVWRCAGNLELALAGDEKVPNISEIKLKRLSVNLKKGDDFQIIAPANAWETTCLLCGEFGLVSCVVSPARCNDNYRLPKMEQHFRQAAF